MATKSNFNEEQDRLHKQLLTEISDNLDLTSVEYRGFRMQITKPLGGAGVLGRCKDVFEIFKNLTKRGNLGILNYKVLTDAFRESNNDDIVDLIAEKEKEIRDASDPPVPANSALKRQRVKVESTITVDETTPSKVKRTEKEDADPSDGKFYTQDGLSYYQTDKKKGYLLILNFVKDRNYTEYDVDNLKTFFGGQLNFQVESPRDDWGDDFTTKEIEKCLKEIRSNISGDFLSKKYYCFVCAILSHGNQGKIKTKDGEYEIENIRKMFGNEHMPKFAGKPKIFFIQACQGSETQSSVETNDEADDEAMETPNNETVDESDNFVAIPNDADVLLAFATTPGNKAFRRQGVGSWFIKECVEVFKKFREQCHLEDMMATVRERVALNWKKIDSGRQMPYTWSTLTKRLKLTNSQC